MLTTCMSKLHQYKFMLKTKATSVVKESRNVGSLPTNEGQKNFMLETCLILLMLARDVFHTFGVGS